MRKVVVVGLGYVGIPVACSFAGAGLRVVGIDINEERIQKINRGECPIVGEEPGLPELFREAYSDHGFRATSDFSKCKDADAILVSVDTPIDMKTKVPGFESLIAALNSIGRNLTKGTLVVVESTIAPGTTQGIVAPTLEKASGLKAGEDFLLAHCPERLKVGKLLHNLTQCDRVIGGINEESRKAALELYGHISKGRLYPTDPLTAETTKTTENAYRDVQIAFANEMAIICEKLDIDVFELRRLVNTSPDRDMHEPGAGVGGHCLPKDSWLLLYGSGSLEEQGMISLAREINDRMPHHLFDLLVSALTEKGIDPSNSKIAVLGFAFIQDSDDSRNTPSLPLIRRIREAGADVVVHDPYVTEFEGIRPTKDLEGALRGSDAAVVVTKHSVYRSLDMDYLARLMRSKIIIDGRGLIDENEAEKKGFIFRGIGR